MRGAEFHAGRCLLSLVIRHLNGTAMVQAVWATMSLEVKENKTDPNISFRYRRCIASGDEDNNGNSGLLSFS